VKTRVEISVIIPVYNVENELKRCLDSVRAQTLQDFEVLLIDDGSKDKSGRICDEYVKLDERFQVFHLENGGVSKARNYGLSKALGTYVAFIDSDDYVEKEYLEVLYKTIKETGSDISMCGYYWHAKDDKSQQKKVHSFLEDRIFEAPALQKVLYENIIKCETEGYYSLWNKLFLNRFIQSNHLRLQEGMSFGEDMIFIMDCLKNCQRFAYTYQCLYNYEYGTTGLYASYRKTFFQDIMICYERMIEQTKDFNEVDPQYLNLSFKYYHYINRHIQGIVSHEKKRKKEIEKIYRHKTVQQIFNIISQIDTEEMQRREIVEYELKIPRWVEEGKIRKAISKTIYVFDEHCLLRKCRRLVDRLRGRKANGKS